MGRTTFIVFLLLAGLAGCGPASSDLPADMQAYEALQRSGGQAYSQHVILLHNLQRVLDGDLKPAQRTASLEVVVFLGGDAPGIRSQLASMLRDPAAPPEVRQGILSFLLRKDYPDLAGHVVQAMPQLQRDSALHNSVMEWLNRHPTGSVLSEVVALWASEPAITGPGEDRYRMVIERMTGRMWQDALLNAINTPDFTASGQAVEVLFRRLGKQALRTQLERLAPQAQSLRLLQMFLLRFEYMPETAQEYECIVQAAGSGPAAVDDTARLAVGWNEEGYRFNIRDLHLLSRLAGDPLRRPMRRSQLLAEVGQAINPLQHARSQAAAGQKDDRFWMRVDALSMADLWNLKLLHEFLSRQRTHIALGKIAAEDRKDTSAAYGGLIFYRAGQAEGTQYPPQSQSGNDLAYVPKLKGKYGNKEYDFLKEQRNSLCRFICHFEKAANATKCGPTAEELKDAEEGNYYGLVLTSLGEETMAAHYFNPTGEVISLGIYPLAISGK